MDDQDDEDFVLVMPGELPTTPAWRRLVSGEPQEGDVLPLFGWTKRQDIVRVKVVYREGRHRVIGVAIDAPEGEEITIDTLRLPVQQATERMMSMLHRRADADGKLVFVDPARDARNAANYYTRQRRRITPALLAEVAQVYRAAEQAHQWPTKAVREHFGPMGQSTAERWVRLAREAGHLPPAE